MAKVVVGKVAKRRKETMVMAASVDEDEKVAGTWRRERRRRNIRKRR